MTCDRAPSFLGAYVLGALDPADRRQAEEHLAGCAECAAEFAEFRWLTALLDRVPAAEATAEPVRPSPELFGRVEAAVQRPARRRRLAVAAAAVVLVAGGATWAIHQPDGEVHTATADGVRLSIVAEEQAAGSALDVTIAGLPVETYCRMVVVDDEGGWHDAGDWNTHAAEVSYRVWSEVPPSDVADVRLVDGDGREFVRVPFTE